jgi:predicted nucleic acid-binding protein
MTWESFAGNALYLDSNIIIFSVEEGNQWSDQIRVLFRSIDEGALQAFTSELTIAEVLAKPMALGARDLIEKYDQLLATDSVVKVAPVDRTVLRAAAELRGQIGTKLLDAIHVATAHLYACNVFLTQDQELGRKVGPELRWLQLADVAKNA